MEEIDERILQVLEFLKDSGEIRFNTQFCEVVGLSRAHLNLIKTGKNHFTPKHIKKVVEKYGVNANWLFGGSEKMFLKEKKNLPLDN